MQLADGSLPLLAPMSEIAGRLAAQVGAHLLEQPNGGLRRAGSGAEGPTGEAPKPRGVSQERNRSSPGRAGDGAAAPG